MKKGTSSLLSVARNSTPAFTNAAVFSPQRTLVQQRQRATLVMCPSVYVYICLRQSTKAVTRPTCEGKIFFIRPRSRRNSQRANPTIAHVATLLRPGGTLAGLKACQGCEILQGSSDPQPWAGAKWPRVCSRNSIPFRRQPNVLGEQPLVSGHYGRTSPRQRSKRSSGRGCGAYDRGKLFYLVSFGSTYRLFSSLTLPPRALPIVRSLTLG